jgi:hypothetical protein
MAESGLVWPCGSWQVWQLIAPKVVSVVVAFAPFTRPMNPFCVWQPTQDSRPAPEGSRVVTACIEFTH